VIKFKPSYVVFDPGEPRLFARTNTGIARDLERRMVKVQAAARRHVRVRSGLLLSTIRKNPGVTARGQHVDLLAGGRGIRYTMVEHDGSQAHIIRARHKKSLRFVWHGQVVFFKQVRHPGTTGTYFLTRSLPLAAG
jgi:hypothetical protein